MGKAYVPLSRTLLDSEVWNRPNEPSCYGKAWVDFVLRASYEDQFVIIDGVKIKLKRGQIAASERFLARRHNWTKSMVRTFLKWCIKREQISVSTSQGLTVITLLNYGDYNFGKKTRPDHLPDVDQMLTGYQPDRDHPQPNGGKGSKNGRDHMLTGSQPDHLPDVDHMLYQNKEFNNLNNLINNSLEPPKKSSIKILSHPPEIENLKEKFPKIDVESEIEKMKDWLKSKGKRQKDYLAFARNWLRKAKEFSQKEEKQKFDNQSDIYSNPIFQSF